MLRMGRQLNSEYDQILTWAHMLNLLAHDISKLECAEEDCEDRKIFPESSSAKSVVRSDWWDIAGHAA